MNPIFSVKADGVDLTDLISDRLLSLRVTDEAGVTSDQFDISLDNRDNAVATPSTGASLEIAMGYEGDMLFNLGRYTVDEVSSSGMPNTLSISGKAADMKASLKSWKKRDWHQTTLGEILGKIAAEHGMTALIAAPFKAIKIDHLDQVYESDLNLLTRLADQYGAVTKPAGGHLLFVARGAGVAADGKPMPPAYVIPSDVKDWQASIRERQFYARVGAHWKDRRSAAVRYLYAGSGDPVMYIRHPYKSEADALAAAEAKLRQLQRGRTALSLSLIGRPALCAEMPIILTGFSSLADGEWVVTRAEHAMDGAGMTTRIEAQRRDDFLDNNTQRSSAES